MIFSFIIFLFLFFFNIVNNEKIELNAVAYATTDESQVYSYVSEDFNEYALKNNINISIKLNLLTSLNSTLSVDDYSLFLESLLYKKSKKYDLIIYDSVYISKFASNFVNLYDALPKEHINMYDKTILSQLDIYKNRLIGLPVSLCFTVLYSNLDMLNKLNKYNKKIPKTWDELIEISKFISEKETELNNTQFITFNGLFCDNLFGIYSIKEFIYSYRKTIDSPYPEIRSEESIKSLKMLKKMKNEIASSKIYKK